MLVLLGPQVPADPVAHLEGHGVNARTPVLILKGHGVDAMNPVLIQAQSGARAASVKGRPWTFST